MKKLENRDRTLILLVHHYCQPVADEFHLQWMVREITKLLKEEEEEENDVVLLQALLHSPNNELDALAARLLTRSSTDDPASSLIALTNRLPTTFPESTLEDPSERWCVLLESIREILTKVDDVFALWGGNLVARLADSACVALSNYHKKYHTLYFESLKTLQAILQVSSQRDYWRNIFPGLFWSLYKFWSALHRAPAGGRLSLLQEKCLDTMRCLFQQVLIVLEPAPKTSALDLLAKVVDKKASPQDSTAPKEDETESKEAEPSFDDRLKKLVVQPVILVLKQALAYSEVHSSLHQLCRVLIRPMAWTKDGPLQTLALETIWAIDDDQASDMEMPSVAPPAWTSRLEELLMTCPVLLLQGGTKLPQHLTLICSYLKRLPTKTVRALVQGVGVRDALLGKFCYG